MGPILIFYRSCIIVFILLSNYSDHIKCASKNEVNVYKTNLYERQSFCQLLTSAWHRFPCMVIRRRGL